MNKRSLLLATSAMVLANVASAQPSRFQGAFGQLGTGYESASQTKQSATLTIDGAAFPIQISSNDASSMVGTFALGWYQEVQKGFLLGIGAEYSPFPGSGADKTATSQVGPAVVSNKYRWQKEESQSVFVSPAMTVGADGLGYAKIGYSRVRAADFTTRTDKLTGYSLGLGYRQIMKGGWYGFIEANYANYGKTTLTETDPPGGQRFDASATNGLATYNGVVGIGYKF